MLLAYIDEIGEPGAFVGRDHPRYNTSPAFGYAGFLIPADHAREFGAIFVNEKRRLFSTELVTVSHPGRWERKGADIFRPEAWRLFPQQVRVFASLVNAVRRLNGALFYYADEKPVGTPRQTDLNTTERETAAMQEALNRIARHSDRLHSNVMVVIDQVNEKTRSERLPRMYAHVLGRSHEHPEMRRVIEPPMHVDSRLSSNIQFADWVAACTTRAIEYQLIEDSAYSWVTTAPPLQALRGSFTWESKLHLDRRSIDDMNNDRIFERRRVMFPPGGNRIGAGIEPAAIERLRAAAERRGSRP